MSLHDELMGDEIYIQSPNGNRVGPIKASVQRDKVYINDETLVIEEGGKILRPLPNGKCESHTILVVDFHKDPFGELSHYEVKTRKDSSLVPMPSSTTININNSQGIQIGDNNIQHIIGSLDQMIGAIDSSSSAAKDKSEVKSKLKAFLSHPITIAVLGGAAKKLIERL
jgi:hypothetical protein